jgi:integrase
MTPRLKSALEELKQVAPPQEVPRPNDLVFGITSTIKTAWETLRNNAAIIEFRLHDCRHTATTRMIASGSPHMEVMKITGHTQLKTFLRYLNITPETARNVSNRLSDYLNQNGLQNQQT